MKRAHRFRLKFQNLYENEIFTARKGILSAKTRKQRPAVGRIFLSNIIVAKQRNLKSVSKVVSGFVIIFRNFHIGRQMDFELMKYDLNFSRSFLIRKSSKNGFKFKTNENKCLFTFP